MKVTIDVSPHLIEAMRNTHRIPEAQSRSGLTPRGGLTDQELAEKLVGDLVYRYLSPSYWSQKMMEQLVGLTEEES